MHSAFRARTALPVTTATVLLTVLCPSTATADSASSQCTFSKENHKYVGTPWALQRVNLDELWSQSKGKNVKVAVIDTGVDTTNPQLTDAVDVSLGTNLLPRKDSKGQPVEGARSKATTDTVGHGTRVAGIIAARPMKGTGFVGLAPEATIIPIKQNDAEGHGTAATLAVALRYAIHVKADVINISQDTANAVVPGDDLHQAVNEALDAGIVVVASAGNDGLGGNDKKTYPASWAGVLAVAASDRNNERAAFSQSGDFVGVAAPGVDMISTVPKGGHCSDNGTSFSAPYVAGVAALIKAKHPKWKAREIVAQIEQTAERSIAGHDRLVGWGVVDPVRALTEDDHPIEAPHSDTDLTHVKAPTPAELTLGETPQERTARIATYIAIGVAVLVAGLSGGAVALRDARRRRRGLERGIL
ncbi:peptidase S8 [Streptomyces sp. MUSC 125]|uniref:type VII secretion-associated serine protease mycosin n=1 Tax=Streptomyces sp. MUSC 125 TaxID=1428624 RepID=UPI00057E6A9C|nr:type VII secretion-associated serine protease mycosin [Streptomyces sp. MUSC 125]KIE23490.1 peptidase S8 [Streptomyces sp. MUSC 125]